MSGQAEQMKGMVGELIALVEGSKNGGSTTSPSMVAPPTVRAHSIHAALSGKERALAVAKEKSPEHVIPMDEGEFKDF